jgi:hypothetical protein
MYAIIAETNFNNSIVILFIESSYDRKRIHLWLEQNHPKIGKRSVTLDCFPIERNQYGVCKGHTMELEYFEGSERDGSGAHYSQYCLKHNRQFFYEPAFDRGSEMYFKKSEHNAIIIGNRIESKNYQDKRIILDDKMKTVIFKSFIVDRPDTMTIKNLQIYLSKKISSVI